MRKARSARQAGLQNNELLPGSYGLAQVPEQQGAPPVVHSRLSVVQTCGVRHTPLVQESPEQQPCVVHDWPSSRQTGTAAQTPFEHDSPLQHACVPLQVWLCARQLLVTAQVPPEHDSPGQHVCPAAQLAPVD